MSSEQGNERGDYWFKVPKLPKIVRNVWAVTWRLGVVGTAVFGVEEGIRSYAVPHVFQDETGTGNPTIDEYYNNLIVDRENKKDSAVDAYQEARESFISEANILLQTHHGKETIESINRKRVLYVEWGLDLLNVYFLTKDISVNGSSNSIEIKDLRNFDLENTYDVVLLDEWIQLIMDKENLPDPVDKFRAQKWLEDIEWLITADLNIVIQDDAFAFPRDKVFPILARYYRFSDELGYSAAKNIVFEQANENSEIAGKYRDGAYVIYSYAFGGTVIHEETHNQSDSNSIVNIGFFNALMDEAFNRAEQNGEPIDVLSTFITSYPATKDTPIQISRENLSEILEEYFINGVGFRRRLNELYLDEAPEYEIVRAEYEAATLYFGGKEFTVDGEVFVPEIGDVFEISDPQGSTRGIRLKFGPESEIDFHDPEVFDGGDVVILDGPHEVINQDDGEISLWWLVQDVVGIGPRESNNVGWMNERWFGHLEVPSEISGQLVEK